MKSSCFLGGAADPGCVPADSADFDLPDVLSGESSDPRTPQAPSARQTPARTRPATKPLTVDVTRMPFVSDASLESGPTAKAQQPALKGQAPSLVLALGDLFLQPLTPGACHLADILWRGSPIADPAGNRLFRAQDRENVLCYAGLDRLHGGQGKFFQRQ